MSVSNSDNSNGVNGGQEREADASGEGNNDQSQALPIQQADSDNQANSVNLSQLVDTVKAAEPPYTPESAKEVSDRIKEEKGESSNGNDEPGNSVSESNAGNSSSNSVSGFDPNIHESNPDGTPRFTADGSYRKKRGRKSGSPNSIPSNPAKDSQGRENVKPVTPVLTGPALEKACRATAKVMISTFEALAQGILDKEEWDLSGEKQELENVWTDYFVQTGNPNLPIWVPPVFTSIIVIAKHGNQPKTIAKLKEIGQKVGLVR